MYKIYVYIEKQRDNTLSINHNCTVAIGNKPTLVALCYF